MADTDDFVAEVRYQRKDQAPALHHANHPPAMKADAPNRRVFRHYWKECIGSGHALLATRADYQRAFQEVINDIGIKGVRMHGIFDDDMSVVLPKQPYAEAVRKNGGKVEDDGLAFTYEFYNVAQIYDYFLSVGIKPIVELSFMPALLANCSHNWGVDDTAPRCETYMHYLGIVMPPYNNPNATSGQKTGYDLWEELVNEFTKFLVNRYTVETVRDWHFEVWNELWGMPYTKEDYLTLYDRSFKAVKAVDSQLKVGGPATMQCQYTGDFVRDNTVRDNNGKITTQNFDFVSSHLYPTDPNCTYPAPRSGEIDCFANTIKDGVDAARREGSTSPFFLTEYNAGLSSELLNSNLASAFIFRNIPLLHDHLDVFSYWTFSDIFEENGMHSSPFEGFNYGIQTQQGIKKPVYRAFELLRDAGGEQLPTVIRDKSEINPVDSRNATITAFSTVQVKPGATKETIHVFASNYAPPHFTINNAHLKFKLKIDLEANENQDSFTCDPTAIGRLIDEDNGNVVAEWEKLGKPLYPTATELASIKAVSHIPEQTLQVTQNYVPANTTSGQLAYIECFAEQDMKTFSAMRVEFTLAKK
eukprot:GILI01003963.1.p1 GENE.GILI01003963.1~~GILI01003963.1.p1  ORF type:complete len:630 (-),score=253.87 GILI01003963.1:247-2007(-)